MSPCWLFQAREQDNCPQVPSPRPHTYTHTRTHRARTLLGALRDPGVHQRGDRSPLPCVFLLLLLAPVLALELKQ